jgi:primosomal protein N' (replication factor Y)
LSELKIVKVAVENTALSFDALFDYSVPEELSERAEVGCRVLVPFGRANTKKIGMIFEVCSKTDAQRVKNITAVLDKTPIFTRHHLDLALWISQTTFCPIYEAVKVQLPSGMHLKLIECYEANREFCEDELENDFLMLYKEIKSNSKPTKRKTLLEKFGFVDDNVLIELEKKGAIKKCSSAEAGIGDKTLKSARLASEIPENVKITDKQKSVISVLEDIGSASVKDICYFTGVSVGVLNTLCKNGVIELYDEEILRVEAPKNKTADTDDISLSTAQNDAYFGLKELLNSNTPNAALLYGVTGSGKTQVFLKLIGDALKMGKTAIIMVPEISLTPQTVKLFYKYFGKYVAVLHSGLSVGERFDEFKRIKNNVKTKNPTKKKKK